jgi:hypothetical protein
MRPIVRFLGASFRDLAHGIRDYPYATPAAWIDPLLLAALIVGGFAFLAHR